MNTGFLISGYMPTIRSVVFKAISMYSSKVITLYLPVHKQSNWYKSLSLLVVFFLVLRQLQSQVKRIWCPNFKQNCGCNVQNCVAMYPSEARETRRLGWGNSTIVGLIAEGPALDSTQSQDFRKCKVHCTIQQHYYTSLLIQHVMYKLYRTFGLSTLWISVICA